VLTFGFVALGWLLGVVTMLVATRLRHHHTWSRWSNWIGMCAGSDAWWERIRRCYECGKSQQQRGGKHTCLGAESGKCPHAADMVRLLYRDTEIRAMEQELG
jgi:hypothetical protein